MSLTAAYQLELKRTRQAVSDALRQQWLALPDYRDGQVDKFVQRVVPIVEAGQRRAVSMTDAYMSRSLGVQPIGLQPTDLIGPAVRNGISPDVVYKRPFETVWRSIETLGFSAAVGYGLSRLVSTGSMDVAMSARDASRAYGRASDRVAGFRRVAHPNCCAFCTSIDGAKVNSEWAAPLHNNCSCTLEPIGVGSSDAHGFETFAIGAVFGGALIEEHGELGPVITNKHDAFTGVDDLPEHYRRQLAHAKQELGQP
jgi:hypothetical protein